MKLEEDLKTQPGSDPNDAPLDMPFPAATGDLSGSTIRSLLERLSVAVNEIREALASDAPAHKRLYLKGCAREICRMIGK